MSLRKTLKFHSAFDPGVPKSTGEHNECNPAVDKHRNQGGVKILLVASYCSETEYKHRPNGPRKMYTDFKLYTQKRFRV